ncbi:nSTAND1 domain-containing NTPase [Tsukamurella soli]|uniref:Novel STAND NTPase 1 domain-containing protein n=1 Tax=Tsukamurella soli TaxID=644556 RepID=A0ABP8JDU9_9ACTN
MTTPDRTTDTAVPDGPATVGAAHGDGVAVFAAGLRGLFTAAGSPTVAEAARAVGVSTGTVSHWRTGRHLPDDFAVIEPLLVWLTVRARNRTRPDDAAPLWTVRQWQALHTTAAGQDPTLLMLHRLLDAVDTWIDHNGAYEQAVREVMLAALDVTADGRAVPGRITPADLSPPTWDAAEVLADLGLLTPTPDEALTLVDPRILDLWPRLHAWIADTRAAVAMRTALVDDALRWHTAGQPHVMLYDHLRLTATAAALTRLHPDAADQDTDQRFRFGDATAAQIPSAAAGFWAASQHAATGTLTVHKIVMALLITLAVAVVGMAALAGWAWR